MMTWPEPKRSDIWLMDFGQPVGHEAGLRRPALIVSDDRFNVHGLVVVCPITRSHRGYVTHVEIEAKSAGLRETSYIQVEQIRTVSAERLVRPVGRIDAVQLMHVERIVRHLLSL